ncbi:hypothetical protein [Brevibacillus daliensis]|uniref:hypothetical protein n=1 Tax=Brevibacillus daliensis TaxID=2892995 RepID=UPI001E5CB39B|nr:hypothetical protein [Brevibacillus daliensis]
MKNYFYQDDPAASHPDNAAPFSSLLVFIEDEAEKNRLQAQEKHAGAAYRFLYWE